MTRVCIVGVGLIGGSLGMGLRRSKKYHVIGLGRSKSNLAAAKRRGAADTTTTDVRKALSNADIVVLCIPVHKIIPFVSKYLSYFKLGAIVTDAGSVKRTIVSGMALAASKRSDLLFVGAHPISGSEKSGVENARADLFKGAACVITKDHAAFRALDQVRTLWKTVGAKCFLMDSAEHDRILAVTSHLPHLLAFSLFTQADALTKKNAFTKSLIGGAFRDMTRIAGSDADVWAGIISNNRGEIRNASNEFFKQLRYFSTASDSQLQTSIKQLTRAKARW